MNEELSYAEMLEIPVETVTVNRKEKKRRGRAEEDIADRVVESVNDRVESRDPAYAESTPIERAPTLTRKDKIARRVLWGEFAAVCALCAVIFLTNIFVTNSAINTFVRDLWNGSETEAADTRARMRTSRSRPSSTSTRTSSSPSRIRAS